MKIVRTFNQANLYDIDGVQRWLEEMSAQGLHLARWGSPWSKFQKGEPKKIRYRLDPERTGAWRATLPEETKELYEEMGWHYVCSLSSAFYLFRADDPKAPELFTDPYSHALAMKRLKGKVLSNLFVYVLLLLFLGFNLWRNWNTPSPTDITSNLSLITSLIWVLCAPVVLFSIYYALRLLRVYRCLSQGIPIPSSPRWHRGQSVAFSAFLLATCAIFLLSFGLALYKAPQTDYYPLSMVPFSVPSLEEIEGRPDFTQDEFTANYHYGFHPEEGSYALPGTSILAPVQYSIVQTGWDKTVFWKDLLPEYQLNMRYSPRLSIDLYETRWNALAQTLLEYELGAIQRSTRYTLTAQLDLEDFDKSLVYHCVDGSGYRLFLLKGNRLAEIGYSGVQELESHLEIFLTLMDEDWSLP